MGRLVVLGTDDAHSHLIPVNNPSGGVGSLVSGPPSGQSSPTAAFEAWVTSGGLPHEIKTTVSLGGSRATLAARIERWIERNCQRDVLATWQFGATTLIFLDGRHKRSQFEKWWASYTLQNDKGLFVLASSNEDTLDECVAWTEEHVTRGHQIVSVENFRLTVFIDDEEDAVLFKLRWSDHIIA